MVLFSGDGAGVADDEGEERRELCAPLSSFPEIGVLIFSECSVEMF